MFTIDKKNYLPILFAILAAIVAAFSPPLSKMVVTDIPPVMTAAFLNLGSGIGMLLIGLVGIKTPLMSRERRLKKSDLPNLIGLTACEMLAAICMMVGLTLTTAANASLLNNFETVTTAVFALIIFKELVPRRLWVAIILITLGSLILSVEDFSTFSFSIGSLFVLGACVFWGFENNFMKRVSTRNPTEVVIFKGIFASIGCFIIALIMGESLPSIQQILIVMLLGVFVYGIAIMFLIYSQRGLGAAKAGTIYGISPFLAAGISCIMFQELPGITFLIALVLMIPGIYLASTAAKRKRKSTDVNTE